MAFTEVDIATELFFPTGEYEAVLSGGSVIRADLGDPDADTKGFDVVLLGVVVPTGYGVRVEVDCPLEVSATLYSINGDDQTAYDGSLFATEASSTGGPPSLTVDTVTAWSGAPGEPYIVLNVTGPDAEITGLRYETYLAPTPGAGDTSNSFDGLMIVGGPALIAYSVPVTPAPALSSPPVRVDLAVALPMPDLDNGRPT